MITTISVTKFNNIIRDIFNSEELLHNIKIVGEVFGVSTAKTAVYFSIKDEESTLPCICFYADMLSEIKEGDNVIVTGSPNFYTKSGRFNFIVSKIEQSGQGILYQRFLELKDKLLKEGLFDNEHKKPIPKAIKRIGVVTSRDGAVIQDIKNVTWRRNPSIDIVLYNTKVQGKGAENEISEGINFFSEYDGVDVVIVARGGGSLEDLSAFNTEIVARATYNCKKPIVSAVGHETDFTIIDFASDLRAPTPSAAAELLASDTKNSRALFVKDMSRLSRLLEGYIADRTMEFQGTKSLVLSYFESRLEKEKRKLSKFANNISSILNQFIIKSDYQLQLTQAKLNKLNPLDILALGYAKIEQQGKVLKSAKSVNCDTPIDIHFADGTVTAKPIKE